jgi:hypothetical protein
MTEHRSAQQRSAGHMQVTFEVRGFRIDSTVALNTCDAARGASRGCEAKAEVSRQCESRHPPDRPHRPRQPHCPGGRAGFSNGCSGVEMNVVIDDRRERVTSGNNGRAGASARAARTDAMPISRRREVGFVVRYDDRGAREPHLEPARIRLVMNAVRTSPRDRALGRTAR